MQNLACDSQKLKETECCATAVPVFSPWLVTFSATASVTTCWHVSPLRNPNMRFVGRSSRALKEITTHLLTPPSCHTTSSGSFPETSSGLVKNVLCNNIIHLFIIYHRLCWPSLFLWKGCCPAHPLWEISYLNHILIWVIISNYIYCKIS